MSSSGSEPELQTDASSDDETQRRMPPILSELLRVVVIVGGIAMFLFIATGTWPPMVAVESGSMEPNMERGDLIVMVDTDRFVGDGAHESTGVVTHRLGQESGYETFGKPGDVIVYQAGGDSNSTHVIHRAMFWVDEGENWVNSEKVDAEDLSGSTCEEILHCPAPNAGFITKGDANPLYDQVVGISTPVKPEWIQAKAKFGIPYLGWARLVATGK